MPCHKRSAPAKGRLDVSSKRGGTHRRRRHVRRESIRLSEKVEKGWLDKVVQGRAIVYDLDVRGTVRVPPARGGALQSTSADCARHRPKSVTAPWINVTIGLEVGDAKDGGQAVGRGGSTIHRIVEARLDVLDDRVGCEWPFADSMLEAEQGRRGGLEHPMVRLPNDQGKQGGVVDVELNGA